MTQPAISIENIGKKYKLGLAAKKHQNFGEALIDVVKGPFKRFGTLGEKSKTGDDIFWALKDISFEVAPGEVVGIIGRNGAGKSTLLKVLSRITEPTEGQAIIRGRVGSLLEVGTGFHPELTGRENIFLNGAILGMTRVEIRQKFDEIVDFSGVEKFLDTPVKHYSSGMYVRLAFAVAAHVDPEILIVDEVLAVGDAEFQKKCLGKMKDVAGGGRTVLFVSHNMGAVQSLCSRGIWLKDGKVVADNITEKVVNSYLENLHENPVLSSIESTLRAISGPCLTKGRILNKNDVEISNLVAGEDVCFELYYKNPEKIKRLNLVVNIYNSLGICAISLDMKLTGFMYEERREGLFLCRISKLPLPLGAYRCATALQVDGHIINHISNALSFEVVSSCFYDTGFTPNIRYGTCMAEHKWEHKSLEAV